jgi:hypothetical protein
VAELALGLFLGGLSLLDRACDLLYVASDFVSLAFTSPPPFVRSSGRQRRLRGREWTLGASGPRAGAVWWPELPELDNGR